MIPLNLSTGLAQTNMTDELESLRLQAGGDTKAEAVMDAKHVADAVVHIASLPNSVTVLEMNIMYVICSY